MEDNDELWEKTLKGIAKLKTVIETDGVPPWWHDIFTDFDALDEDADSDPFDLMQGDLKSKFPILMKMVMCPVPDFLLTCKNYSKDVAQVIIHLNDTHGWDREQIANWVDSL